MSCFESSVIDVQLGLLKVTFIYIETALSVMFRGICIFFLIVLFLTDHKGLFVEPKVNGEVFYVRELFLTHLHHYFKPTHVLLINQITCFVAFFELCLTA